MKGGWGAPLISAGLAVIITAKVVEKIVFEDVDMIVQRELEASVAFLTKRLDDELDAKNDEEVSDEERQEVHQRVFGSQSEKPPLSEVAGRNERVRYDKILTTQDYKPSDQSEPPVEEAHAVEDDAQEPGRADMAELVVLPTEEFMANESGYMQMSLTYYSDGGVLDEANDLVADFRDMIGAGFPPFGQGSGEKNIVYLRNNKHRQEYEVVYDPGKAADILADPSETP